MILPSSIAAEIRELIERTVERRLAQQGVGRHGNVSSVDPAVPAVKVTYDEGDPANGVPPTVSGWLPVAQVGAGNGWQAVCLPTVGTQVYVAPDMGDIGHGVVMGAVHSVMQPPGKVTPYKATSAIPVVPGEFTLIHEDGTSFRMTAGGPQIKGTLLVDGDIHTSGDVYDQYGSLDRLRLAHNLHRDVDSHGDEAGLNDHQDPRVAS